MDTVSPYLLLAGFSFVEGGEVSLLFAGYLMHTYALHLVPVTIILFLAILASDFLWYRFGTYLYRIPFLRHIDSRLDRLDTLIKARPFVTAITTRFGYGLYHVTLARYRNAGISSVQMIRVLVYTSVTWLVVLGGIVATLVTLIPSAKRYLHVFELIVAFVFVAFFLFERFSTRLLRKELAHIKESEENLDEVP